MKQVKNELGVLMAYAFFSRQAGPHELRVVNKPILTEVDIIKQLAKPGFVICDTENGVIPEGLVRAKC